MSRALGELFISYVPSKSANFVTFFELTDDKNDETVFLSRFESDSFFVLS